MGQVYSTPEGQPTALWTNISKVMPKAASFYLGHKLQILIQVFAEILASYLVPPIHPLPTRLKQGQPAPSPGGFLLDTNETWPWAREDFSPEPPHGYFGGGKVTVETKNQGGRHTGL